jgi:hypothetical protein
MVMLLCVLFKPATARADVVLDWNAIAVNTAIANGQSPFSQARFAAIVQLAVFEAVNAITGDYEPYLGTVHAAPGASADAAAITAAYRVLRTYFSGSAATLDPAYASALALIPDGTPKADGIKAGEAAAKAMIDLRASDGSAPPLFKTPGIATPGEWQVTPSCPRVPPVVGPQLGNFYQWQNVKPFGIPSAADFLLDPPPALTSNRYAKDYNEVKTVGGGVTNPARPQDRADGARFYRDASPTLALNMAARQVAVSQGRSMSDNARALALLNMAISDSLVASFLTKYTYNFWRPETAIKAVDTDANSDGNSKTDPDPTFKPYILTPCFPSYPSNHASGTNGGVEVLRRLYGAGGHAITLSNPASLDSVVAAMTLQYTTFKQITDDVDDARVYGGIHFRFDQEAGGRLGRDVATYVYKNNLRPVHPE